MKRSKRYKKVADTDQGKMYTIEEAVSKAKASSTVKFDSTIELHISFALKAKDKEKPIRGSLEFPNKFGKEAVVVVLTDEAKLEDAKKSGADFVGLDDLVKKIEKGWLDFDVVIATPSVMPSIAKLGRVLGPKGIMPNPKTGTVTDNIEQAVKTYKAGKIDFKADEGGNIHLGIGKSSMDEKSLLENAKVAIETCMTSAKLAVGQKPVKGYITSSMGPSFKISIEE